MERKIAVLIAALFLAALPGTAQKYAGADEKRRAENLPAFIWRDPGDVTKLDLFYGAGGKDDAPDAGDRFTFVKEDLSESNPKFDVKDQKGRTWRVKLGPESQPETAATRLLFAAGYFVDEDYYFAQIRVEKLPHLHRGAKFVEDDGTVRGARLELRDKQIKNLGKWEWLDNPFTGTKELNGLRMMMCLIDNWDLALDNNSIYESGNEQHYAVTDLGAAFGKTGDVAKRSKGSAKDYASAKFIEKISDGQVNFVMHSRPLFFTVFDPSYYRKRTHMEDVGKHIPIADAKWLGHLLGQLSREQIHDCFRAAGYEGEKADDFTQAVQKRIAELNGL